MSHHVTCHVTVVLCASSSSKKKIKEKRKENQYKIRKIKEKKNEIVSVQASYNIFLQVTFIPCSQKAIQYFVGGSLFQASQQWQVDQ